MDDILDHISIVDRLLVVFKLTIMAKTDFFYSGMGGIVLNILDGMSRKWIASFTY